MMTRHFALFLRTLRLLHYPLLIGLLTASPLLTPTARAEPASPTRYSTESAEEARLRHLLEDPATIENPTQSPTVLDSQVSFPVLNFDRTPQLANLRTLQEVFERLRDTRSWRWNRMPDFPRRLMWVYPADGCYLRAELMLEKLQEWGLTPTQKLFIFGNLSYSSKFQQMNWWYHVAPVFRLGKQAYVLDPAINARIPLPVQDWITTLSGSVNEARFALCEAGALNPYSECAQPRSDWDPGDRADTLQNYLETEWMALEEALGQSPKDILGDHPPWR